MRFPFSCLPLVFALSLAVPAWGQSTAGQSSPKNADAPENPQALTKVPSGVILVKGAWSSASDSVTPVPEGGTVTDAFTDEYFGITYPLPKGWTEKYQGPPPSDSGRYVLAQIQAADTSTGTVEGHILVTAQDMFFTPPADQKRSRTHRL